MGRPGGARGIALLALAVVAAALVRWRSADLADWGIDESANLWLGTAIRAGAAPRLGLASSVGTMNLAGAPLLAAPLSLLPDLLAVSRALALAQLAALAALAAAIGRRASAVALALVALAFCPATVLAAPNLWNQYLALPITAGLTALLLRCAERAPGTGGAAVTLLATLLLLQPAVHLAGFADLGAQGALALALLGLADRRRRPAALELPLALAACAALVLYRPWLARTFALTPGQAVLVWGAMTAVIALGADAVHGRLRGPARRAARAPWLAWSVPVLLLACAGGTVVAFFGAQAARRELDGGSWGVLLLAAQVAVAALALPALPGMIADCRAGATPTALLRAWFPGRARGAALLLANAALLLAARTAVVPAMLLPRGRADLLLPLLPALLAPGLLLVASARRARQARIGATGRRCAAASPARARSRSPPSPCSARARVFAPASRCSCRRARCAPWSIGSRPSTRAVGADRRLDIGYDLSQGREWVHASRARPAWRRGTP
ncbi:MAG: hypothetical protein U0802_25350 [Candidatus Binatia bacterium]